MVSFKYVPPLLFILFIYSCSNQDKPKKEVRKNGDSLKVVDSINQTGTQTKNTVTPVSSVKVVITDLLIEGTYIDSQLPTSVESGNWYALIQKEGVISEIVKIDLNQIRYEPSEGEDFAPTIYITTIPKTVNVPLILFNSQGSLQERKIRGRLEAGFLPPEITYELALPGFFLIAEGTSTTNDQGETSYENYGLVFQKEDRFQQLYSDLSFSGKTPTLIWSGDLNADGIPDLLLESSVDPSQMEAHYQLWLSDPGGEEWLKMVAEHKIYPSA